MYKYYGMTHIYVEHFDLSFTKDKYKLRSKVRHAVLQKLKNKLNMQTNVVSIRTANNEW